jgi:hypothetical protein
MSNYARYALVVVLLFFSWKGVSLDFSWPPQDASAVSTPKPSAEYLEWANHVRPIAAGMLPSDRIYLSNLYEAMSFILLRDFERDTPIIASTGDFVTFHTGSLKLAIDKASVGKYPGLAEAIDKTFVNAVGADQQKLDQALQKKLIAACAALSWTLGIGTDE